MLRRNKLSSYGKTGRILKCILPSEIGLSEKAAHPTNPTGKGKATVITEVGGCREERAVTAWNTQDSYIVKLFTTF